MVLYHRVIPSVQKYSDKYLLFSVNYLLIFYESKKSKTPFLKDKIVTETNTRLVTKTFSKPMSTIHLSYNMYHQSSVY